MKSLQKRHLYNKVFKFVTAFATALAVFLLTFLLYNIIISGYSRLSVAFLTSYPSYSPALAGVKSALVGSIWLLGCVVLMVVPLGIGSAIFIEELMPNNIFKKIIQLNVANLAGVPSIVYGILGLVVFVDYLNLGRSVLAGSLTLAMMILPVIIMSSQEALRSSPNSIKEAAYALGATRLQTIFHHVLPLTLPGMLTGVVLAISRAIGEAAPLILIGGLTYVAFLPDGVMDEFTALPIQIFNWTSRPQKEFHELAAAAIVVLLCILMLFNSFAIYLREKTSKSRGSL